MADLTGVYSKQDDRKHARPIGGTIREHLDALFDGVPGHIDICNKKPDSKTMQRSPEANV